MIRYALLTILLALAGFGRATVQVYVAFADTTSQAAFFPNPWYGSPNTTFWGSPGPNNFYHGAAVLIYNPGPNNTVLGQNDWVDGFGDKSYRYRIWEGYIHGGYTIAPGQSLILTQTDGTNSIGNFDPTQDPLSMTANPPSPVVHLTLDGKAVTFTDTAHVMVIGGSNWNSFGRNDSLQWRPIGTFGPSIAAGTGVAPSPITTWHTDNTRQGANTTETSLTPANVAPGTFGMLFQYQVDGQVFAQPLYVPNVTVPGKGIHNLVYVATENNSVYAFDADQPGVGAPIWKFNAGTPVPASDLCAGDQYPVYGITSTPVIDRGRGAIYFVANSKNPDGTYASTLHALDLSTGVEKLNGPSVIKATVKGQGEGGDGNGNVVFNPLYQNQRPALMLWNGVIYICYGSHCDVPPYHGWVLGYSADNVQTQACVYNTSPDAVTANGVPAGGSIWMSGGGPSTDGNSIFLTTANGTFDANTGGRDYGDSILKLAPNGNTLSVLDYFTPSNQAYLNGQDLDYGSSIPLLMPSLAGISVPLLVQTTKTGRIYIVNRNTGSMGNYGTTDKIWKETADFSVDGGAWGNPASIYGTIYFGGAGGTMRGYSFSNGAFLDQAYSQTTAKFMYPGLTPSVSTDGNTAATTRNVVVWGTENASGQAVLHAFAGNDLHELFSGAASAQLDDYVKFTTPTVAAGKVYVGGARKLTVYGGSWFTPAPTITATPSGQGYVISMSSAIPGSVIRYTINGMDPTGGSVAYKGPFTLGVSRLVKAQVYAPQYVPGPVATKNIVAGNGSISLRCGGSAIGIFQTDAFYTNGTPYSVTTPVVTTGVTNPAPQAAYQSERWGDSFSYIFSGLRAGINYEVRLHFAEIYDLFPGMRVFNVNINGVPALTNYDIVQDTGGPFIATAKAFTVPASVGPQTIQIDFQGVVDNAKVSAIEIFPTPSAQATKGKVEAVMLRRPTPSEAAALGRRAKHRKAEMNGLSQAQRAAIQRAYRCRIQNVPVKDR